MFQLILLTLLPTAKGIDMNRRALLKLLGLLPFATTFFPEKAKAESIYGISPIVHAYMARKNSLGIQFAVHGPTGVIYQKQGTEWVRLTTVKQVLGQ